jgi:hypothetical protein
MARSTTRVQADRLTRKESATVANHVRLRTEDWNGMTAAANASPDHVKSLDRWIRKAREENPHLDDAQAERQAERLRRDHYVRMGRLSAEKRRIERELADLEAEAGGEAA